MTLRRPRSPRTSCIRPGHKPISRSRPSPVTHSPNPASSRPSSLPPIGLRSSRERWLIPRGPGGCLVSVEVEHHQRALAALTGGAAGGVRGHGRDPHRSLDHGLRLPPRCAERERVSGRVRLDVDMVRHFADCHVWGSSIDFDLVEPAPAPDVAAFKIAPRRCGANTWHVSLGLWECVLCNPADLCLARHAPASTTTSGQSQLMTPKSSRTNRACMSWQILMGSLHHLGGRPEY